MASLAPWGWGCPQLAGALPQRPGPQGPRAPAPRPPYSDLMVGDSRPGRALGSLRLALIVAAVLAVGVVQWFRTGDQAGPDRSQAASPAPPPQPSSAPAAPPASTPSASRDASERRDLSLDEQQGGHTLARHVGKSDQDLRDRLQRERGISAASSYSTRAIAERTVTRALAQEQSRVAAWIARMGNRPNLALTYRGPAGVVVGRSLERRRREAVDCTDAVVVLRWNGRDGFYVLTSYPEAGR